MFTITGKHQPTASLPNVKGHKTSVNSAHAHLLRLSLGVLLFLLLTNLGAMTIMQSRTAPFTRINGIRMGLVSHAAAASRVQSLMANMPLTIHIDDKIIQTTYGDLGITIDEDATKEQIESIHAPSAVPLLQMFANGVVNIIPVYTFDDNKLNTALKDDVPTIKKPATSAKLVIPYLEKNPMNITASKAGEALNVDIAVEQIKAAVENSTSTISEVKVQPKFVAPEVHESLLARSLDQAEALTAAPVTVRDTKGNKRTTISTRTLRSMLTTDKTGNLIFDPVKLKVYVREELALYFFSEPIHKRVDNNVVRVAGKDGATLDTKKAADVLQQKLVTEGLKDVSLGTTPLRPATVTNGVYPKTEMGLHALISDFDAEKTGDYRIIVHQLKEDGMRATHQGAVSSIPASTYKAFIAYAAMWATEQGEMTLEDRTPFGSVTDCMYEMIHYSTDHCAFAIQNLMTWQRVDDILHAAGFENTALNNEDRIKDKYTTAQDEFKLLKGLYDGSLLNKEHTDHLLTLMKEQKWRSGIPGGSKPAVVADKVGFYAGWINDIGIVYAGNPDYIIVAISDGGSFWEINDLSRRVYNFFTTP